ncbi:MAG: hypothetical protein R3C03_09130 [Pirellulaceae bacterium]
MIRKAIPSLALMVCLLSLCCGCSTNNGGDPAVWHDQKVNGSGEILAVQPAASPANSRISIRFTHDDGQTEEKILERLKLAEIEDLPAEYRPKVGDELKLRIGVRYQRKMSVGPPDLLHDPVDQRTFTCLELILSEPEEVNNSASQASSNGSEP